MRAADVATITAGTPQDELMRRAGHAVARAARTLLGGCYGRHVAAVCGSGNNGADARIALELLRGWGARTVAYRADDQLPAEWTERFDLIIDGMFGTGFAGDVRPEASALIGQINRSATPVVSVDIPSGLSGDTGRVDSVAIRATRTVTFEVMKPGLLMGDGPAYAGELIVAPIGIEFQAVDAVSWDTTDVAARWPSPHQAGHKWSVAPVLIVGGSPGLQGAPHLSALGASATGSTMVVILTPSSLTVPDRPDLVVRRVRALETALDGERAFATIEPMLERFGAVVVGPGMGHGQGPDALIGKFLRSDRPLVIDADALSANSLHWDAIAARNASTVLTPHHGEFVRMTGETPADRLEACRKVAAQLGDRAVVALKGPGTVIVSCSRESVRCAIDRAGDVRLATAGSGDVLSGIAASLLAQHVDPWEATVMAAHVHGLAGRRMPFVGGNATQLAHHVAEIAGGLGEPRPGGPRPMSPDR